MHHQRRADMPDRYSDIDFTPPDEVAEQAHLGLILRRFQDGDKAGLTVEEADDQDVGSGVQRAVNLKNQDSLEPDTINQMVAFFARHEDNADIDNDHLREPWEDNGFVSWLLWGGDPGREWAESIQSQMEEADEASQDKESHIGRPRRKKAYRLARRRHGEQSYRRWCHQPLDSNTCRWAQHTARRAYATYQSRLNIGN